MSLLLIKASKDKDCYVLWTTISDGPLAWGTRMQLTAKPVFKDVIVRISRRIFNKPYSKLWWDIANTAFKEADANGSALFTGVEGFFNWNEGDQLIYAYGKETKIISRELFSSFMEAYKKFSDDASDHPNILKYTLEKEASSYE